MKSNVLAIAIVALLYVQVIAARRSIRSNVVNEVVDQLGSLPLPSTLPIVTTPEDLIRCYHETLTSNSSNDPDIQRRMPELASAYGYHVETHNFHTEDNYTLTVFRVRNTTALHPNSKVVILAHGYGGSSTNWFLQKQGRNLGMILPDLGYDVWVKNDRGTTYSTGHLYLAQNDAQYWDFSWHEMGVYDVPALINYIEATTGQNKMYYVGYSQGTAQFMVAMSQRPELNDKIDTAFLLSPIAYVSHSTNVIRTLSPLGNDAQYLANPTLGGHVAIAENKFNTSLATVCSQTLLLCAVCDNLEYLIFGYDASQTDYTRMAVSLSKFPDTMCTKSAVHFAQSMSYIPPSFRQFDYGTPSANEARYGHGITSPPSYDLSKVTAKIFVLYGLNDNLGTPMDSKITFGKLGVAPSNANNQLIEVNWTQFNHMDFVNAKDADTLVYSTIVSNITP